MISADQTTPRRHDDGPAALTARAPATSRINHRAVRAKQEPVRRRRRHRRSVPSSPATQPHQYAVVRRVGSRKTSSCSGWQRQQSGWLAVRSTRGTVPTMFRLLLQVHRTVYQSSARWTKSTVSSKSAVLIVFYTVKTNCDCHKQLI